MKTVKHEWCAHFTPRRFSRLLYVMWFWRHRGKCAAYSSAVRAISSLWEKRSKQSWCKVPITQPFFSLYCISKTTTRWGCKAECERNISPLTIKTPKQVFKLQPALLSFDGCQRMKLTLLFPWDRFVYNIPDSQSCSFFLNYYLILC